MEVLCGFTDANHANAREAERKSITGFCFFLFGNLICWKSKVQPLTAASTHEAELIALSFCADECIWMRNLLNEVGVHITQPIPILCDNQGTVFTANNPSQNQRSKHLDIRYFRVRQFIESNLMDVLYVPTTANLADFFTKSLTPVHFYQFKHLLMNTDQELCQRWAKEGRNKTDKILSQKLRALQLGSDDDS